MAKRQKEDWDNEIVVDREYYSKYGYIVEFYEDGKKKTMEFANEEEAHEYFKN